MAVSSYRDLDVWKKGVQLAKAVYHLTAALPKHETFGISSQLQRAAVSIPANIAEGHARSSTKDFLRFLAIARGSLAELETLLTLAVELEYCHSHEAGEIMRRCDEVSRMLSGLRNSLKRRVNRDA
jgi:four helix bundle protein